MPATVVFNGRRCSSAGEGAVTTGFTAWGATPTSETDYFYQGGACISCQVKTAEVGVYFTDPTPINYGTSRFVWLSKIIQSNYTAIDGLGLQLFIGNDTTNHYRYEIFSATSYPPVGGFQIVPIDPSITGYVTQTVGTPNITTIDFYGIKSDANATAKAPNLGIDAIDYIASGTGLSAWGTGGTMDDFISMDEGSLNNRWGIVSTRSGIIYVTGTLQFASESSGLVFSDSNKTIVFPNGRFGTGFAGLKIYTQQSSTNVNFTSSTFIGRGQNKYDGVSADTRPVLAIEASVGSATFSNCNFLNFNEASLNYSTTLNDCVFVEPRALHQRNSTISGCTFNEPSVASGVSFLKSNNPSRVTDCIFISSSDGHAMECNTPGTYDWIGNIDMGYTGTRGTNANPSTGSNNAMFYNNSGGHIVLNVAGGALFPSIRNAPDSSTEALSSVTLSFTVTNEGGSPLEGVLVFIDDASSLSPFVLNTSTNAGGYAFTTWTGGSLTASIWRARKYGYKNVKQVIDIGSTDINLPVTMIVDPQQI